MQPIVQCWCGHARACVRPYVHDLLCIVNNSVNGFLYCVNVIRFTFDKRWLLKHCVHKLNKNGCAFETISCLCMYHFQANSINLFRTDPVLHSNIERDHFVGHTRSSSKSCQKHQLAPVGYAGPRVAVGKSWCCKKA